VIKTLGLIINFSWNSQILSHLEYCGCVFAGDIIVKCGMKRDFPALAF
jgi:hypothetical protein